MSAGVITGVVRVKVNGELLESEEGAELELGGDEHEAVVGHAFYGTKRKIKPSMLKYTLPWKADTPVEKLRALVEATHQFIGDAGAKYSVPRTSPSKTPKIKDGSVEIEMTGAPAVKLK